MHYYVDRLFCPFSCLIIFRYEQVPETVAIKTHFVLNQKFLIYFSKLPVLLVSFTHIADIKSRKEFYTWLIILETTFEECAGKFSKGN